MTTPRKADQIDSIKVKVEIKVHPQRQIINSARRNAADLMVICTRGQSGVFCWLMGDIADRVVRGADVPVLLGRAAQDQHQERGKAR
jgi:nucleotide-binding universal stress UspA family protein